MNIDESYEKLLEQLTIDYVLEAAITPPFGGFLPYNISYRGYYWAHPTGFDKVYRDKDGKYHKIYGPAYISNIYDIEIWYKHGLYHRNDGGPALRHKSTFLWYQEDKLHRLDGPAVVSKGNPKEYWINGQKLSPKEYKKEIDRRKRKGIL